VKTVAETLKRLLFAGLKGRKVGETAMNIDSSRSHSMFKIYIETAMEGPVSGKQKIKAGKLNQLGRVRATEQDERYRRQIG
jgi:hypothetical protein